MIRFACPGCSSTFSVDDGKAGKSGKCPKCGAAFIIPAAEAAPVEAPPPLPVPPPPAPVLQSPAADPNLPVEIDPCPKCQTKLSVAASDLGNDVECPYCKTVFASARAGTRPPAPPPAPGKKSSADLDFSGKPKPRRERDEVEDDDRPRRRKRDDDEDDRPSKRKGRREDEDEDRPSRRGKPPVSRRDDDDEDDDRPSRRRSRSRRDDDDEDDDYDDRPSRRRSRSRRRSGGSGERSGAVTAASVMTIVVGALWLIGAGLIFFGSAFLFNAIGGLPRGFGANAQARDAAEGALVGMTLCCGVPTLLMSILHILGGVFALQRKTAGRIIVIICASLALLFGLFALYAMFRMFFVLPVFPPFEIILYQLLNLLMTLGYGTFAMIVMCRSDYADEFD